jgi:hypothetical protein
MLIPPGLPFSVASFVPAEKYVTMSTTFSRSALSVNEDMPSSYFLAAMPGRMPSNALFWNSTCRPSFWPMALPRSTSMPMIVVPSAAKNSLGAYDASEPTTILPSDATSGGTSAASAASFCTVGTAAALVAAG